MKISPTYEQLKDQVLDLRRELQRNETDRTNDRARVVTADAVAQEALAFARAWHRHPWSHQDVHAAARVLFDAVVAFTGEKLHPFARAGR